jgi:hypothetical protein
MHNSGIYPIDCELFVDARAVYGSVTAKIVKTPAGRIFQLQALAMREHLETKQLSKITWSDTRDMVTDALDKGCIDREGFDCSLNAAVGGLSMR